MLLELSSAFIMQKQVEASSDYSFTKSSFIKISTQQVSGKTYDCRTFFKSVKLSTAANSPVNIFLSHLYKDSCLSYDIPFLINFPSLYFLKTPENGRFFYVFKEYKNYCNGTRNYNHLARK